MDIVNLDGTDYTKASAIAKQFKYTSDYIGQLCRAKKVDARLVGRTWFVSEKSLLDYRKTKYAKSEESESYEYEVAIKKEPNIKVSRTDVESVPRRHTLEKSHDSYGTPSKTRTIRVSYDLDDGSLIPNITKKHLKPPRTIVVEQANAQKLKVSGKEKQVLFHSSELPEVSLSGKLRVTTYPDAVSDIEDKPINKDISAEENLTIEPVSVKLAVKPEEVSVEQEVVKLNVEKKILPAAKKSSKVFVHPRSISMTKKQNTASVPSDYRFTPNLISDSAQVVVHQSLLISFSPLIATFIAILCVGLVFSASTLVTVSDSVYNSKIVLQAANLLSIFEHY